MRRVMRRVHDLIEVDMKTRSIVSECLFKRWIASAVYSPGCENGDNLEDELLKDAYQNEDRRVFMEDIVWHVLYECERVLDHVGDHEFSFTK